MLRGGLHQHSSSHQDLTHLHKLPNTHRGDSNAKSHNGKLQVSISGDMGPTPPGHHHRILSDGMSLITPVVLTERSSSHLRSSAPVPYDQRLSKYVIHSSQVNDVSRLTLYLSIARPGHAITRAVPHKFPEHSRAERERRDHAELGQPVRSTGELPRERTREPGLSEPAARRPVRGPPSQQHPEAPQQPQAQQVPW